LEYEIEITRKTKREKKIQSSRLNNLISNDEIKKLKKYILKRKLEPT
jgi:hypothetical protein